MQRMAIVRCVRCVRAARCVGAGALAVALVGAAGATPAQTSMEDEGAIRYRQHLMEAIGADLGALSDLMKYGLPLARASVHAESLQAHATLIEQAFERRVVEGPTDAKPEIWQEPEKHREAVQKLQAELDELARVAKLDDRAALGAQLKKTGQACGSCHDSFRKPKEESYKRKGGD